MGAKSSLSILLIIFFFITVVYSSGCIDGVSSFFGDLVSKGKEVMSGDTEEASMPNSAELECNDYCISQGYDGGMCTSMFIPVSYGCADTTMCAYGIVKKSSSVAGCPEKEKCYCSYVDTPCGSSSEECNSRCTSNGCIA